MFNIYNSSKTVRSIILAIIIVVLAVVIAILINRFPIWKSAPNYAAVYLSSGEMYFGKFSKFPSYKLTDVIFLQKDGNGNINVQKFSDAAWQPQEPIYLNSKQVIFWTKLKPSSPIVQIIEGTLSQQQQQPTAQPPDIPPASSPQAPAPTSTP